ncbi:hypothetical protein PUN28_006954 [Cardiocondyla obscurior]|uniref:Uncharacterized protein n=1 Tax=Cardiocondyla obscurior TaxID=286306 RepID=A0AAW2G6P1_9HYME
MSVARGYHDRDKTVKRSTIAMIEHRESIEISRDVECVACHDVYRHRRRIREPPTIMNLSGAVWQFSLLSASLALRTALYSRANRPTLLDGAAGIECRWSVFPSHQSVAPQQPCPTPGNWTNKGREKTD